MLNFQQISANLGKLRSEGNTLKSPILFAAAQKCSAKATLRFMNAPTKPQPDLPRRLSDSILKASSAAKRARTAFNDASAAAGFLQRWADAHWMGCDICSALSHQTQQDEAGTCVGGATDQRSAKHVAWLEAVVVLLHCVSGMHNECLVLDSAAVNLHVEMDSEDAEGIGEVLSLKPFIHDDVVAALAHCLASVAV